MTQNPSAPATTRKFTRQRFVKPRGEPFPAQSVALGKNMVLNIASIELAFTLPHRYHERMLHEIRSAYRQAEILLSRRVGYLGSHQPVRYSLLAYLQSPQAEHVQVRGAALTSHEAWTYNALIPLKDLGIGVAKILEHIAALPIHSAVPHGSTAIAEASNATDSFCDTG